MKKNYPVIRLFRVFMVMIQVIVYPMIANGQNLTETQKQERCKQTRKSIVEQEKLVQQLEYVLSDEARDIKEKADQNILVVRSNLKDNIRTVSEKENELKRISKEYKFNWDSCYRLNNTGKGPADRCANLLVAKLYNDIKPLRFESRFEKTQELTSAKAKLEDLRGELVNLGCDDNKNSGKAGAWVGTWQGTGQWLMVLKENGNTISGTLTEVGGNSNTTLSGCSSIGNNKLSCKYSTTEKKGDEYVTVTGMMEMTLMPDYINSFWKDPYGNEWPLQFKRK